MNIFIQQVSNMLDSPSCPGLSASRSGFVFVLLFDYSREDEC